MAWQRGALVLPLFILYFFAWLCPYGSFGQDVRCWWNKDKSVDQSLSIECHADPQSFLQKCGQCQLRLITSENEKLAVPQRCTRNTANFTARLSPQAMHTVTCTLTCHNQAPGDCTINEGYLPPACLIPLYDGNRNIHCHWTSFHNLLNPANFTLHWEEVFDTNNKGSYVTGNNDHGIIPRSSYSSDSSIKVWVTASSGLGSVQSDEAVFNTINIGEPLPPSITNHTFDPLEIFWTSEEEDYESGSQVCEVQYKKECDQDWTEVEEKYMTSFVLDNPVPFTKYVFHVRCGATEQVIMSNWSSYIATTPAGAPVGTLDVWSDCESNSDESSCTILWKEMPKVQARGSISYLVKVKLNNGLDKANYTYAGPCEKCESVANNSQHAHKSHLSCHQEQDQCWTSQLTVPIREVKDICVTANSLLGESSPALVALPKTGLLIPDVLLKVTGESKSMDVSWSAPSLFIENIQEYVVQHKPIGLPRKRCLNWVKVNRTQNSVTLRGQFENYTAYNVSLFAVVNNCSHLLQSAIAYTVQGVPPRVTSLHVTDISSSSVNLTWNPIPPDQSQGFILKYLVGLSNHTEWNVSGDERSILLPELSPGQQYEAWIRAVTAAGEGERTTVVFTKKAEDYSIMVVVLSILMCLIIPIILIILIASYFLCFQGRLWLKIPDPINSSLFQQNNNQFRQSWLVPHSPSAHTLKISQVDALMVSESPLYPEDELIVELPEVDQQPEEDREHGEEKELQESGGLARNECMQPDRTNDYRQAIDSSEEDASREDEDGDWDEPSSPSDYEKHFLPPVEDM